jgi:hypothetical protein
MHTQTIIGILRKHGYKAAKKTKKGYTEGYTVGKYKTVYIECCHYKEHREETVQSIIALLVQEGYKAEETKLGSAMILVR